MVKEKNHSLVGSQLTVMASPSIILVKCSQTAVYDPH